MIPATVGRVLLLWGARGVNYDLNQPFRADICYVWSDRLVNVSYNDHQGQAMAESSVVLLQDDDAKPHGIPFCTWMPYQIGQARKHETPDPNEAKRSG